MAKKKNTAGTKGTGKRQSRALARRYLEALLDLMGIEPMSLLEMIASGQIARALLEAIKESRGSFKIDFWEIKRLENYLRTRLYIERNTQQGPGEVGQQNLARGEFGQLLGPYGRREDDRRATRPPSNDPDSDGSWGNAVRILEEGR